MSKNKLFKFAEIKTFSHVFEFPHEKKGQWHTFFNNANPLVVELACGKGEYTCGLAALYAQQNFIGMDIKGNRLWVGAKKSIASKLSNVAFIRGHIDAIDNFFAPQEIREIWITFPDPFLSKARKRLTHPKFLRQYLLLLQKGGKVHLKTDSPVLYEFTKTVIALFQLPLLVDIDNLYAEKTPSLELQIKTHYEGLNISKSNCIFYLQFELRETILDNSKDILLKTIMSDLA